MGSISLSCQEITDRKDVTGSDMQFITDGSRLEHTGRAGARMN